MTAPEEINPRQPKSTKMNIIEALNTLQARGIESVEHPTGSTGWSIDNLKDSINEALAEDRLEETSDGGEWCLDAAGIEQLDKNGYRNGNRYNVI